jgi:hypothetical protein
LPFTLLLPYVDLFWTSVLSVVIGIILSSAFSAILVFAQELIPGKVGMISGLFFGFAFGVAGVGAAMLGKVADLTSISFVYQICSLLPVIGILAYFLPNVETRDSLRAKQQSAIETARPLSGSQRTISARRSVRRPGRMPDLSSQTE